jgi:hypothetical protein
MAAARPVVDPIDIGKAATQLKPVFEPPWGRQ